MQNEKNSKKQVTLKPAEFQALINQSKKGDDLDFFLELTNIERLKHNVIKSLAYYLHQDNGNNIDKCEIDEILLLSIFLEKHKS